MARRADVGQDRQCEPKRDAVIARRLLPSSRVMRAGRSAANPSLPIRKSWLVDKPDLHLLLEHQTVPDRITILPSHTEYDTKVIAEFFNSNSLFFCESLVVQAQNLDTPDK